MQKIIETLKAQNEALAQENKKLKTTLGGYKSSNERYRKRAEDDANTINTILEQLKNAKEKLIEANSLYEGMVEEVDDLKEMLKVSQKKDEQSATTPWYKTLFRKK